MHPNSFARLLLTRQLRSGGWSYFGSEQSSVEATTLAVMAVTHRIAGGGSIRTRASFRSAAARRRLASLRWGHRSQLDDGPGVMRSEWDRRICERP
jgi:hypothetical protein